MTAKGKGYTLQDFIKKSVERHGNKYNYDLVVYKNSLTKIKIKCNSCGLIFDQHPNSHMYGRGCPSCARRGPSINGRTKAFILKAKTIHGDEYDYSNVNYNGNRQKISVKNNVCGHIFDTTPERFLRLKNCKICHSQEATRINRFNNFVKKANKIHNNEYDYSVGKYINFSTRFEVLHKRCNKKFLLLPANHICYKNGCPNCNKANNTKTTKKFIIQAQAIHGNKYDYSKVNYKKSNIKVEIICKSCESVLWIQPTCHLSKKTGCVKCHVKSMTKSLDQFILEAKAIHGDKYDYSKVVYKNSNTKVEIFCKHCQKGFWQIPISHLHGGHGCIGCAKKSISKPSQRWLDYLNIPNEFGKTREVRIRIPGRKNPFIADGYDPQTNTIYEFHGDYWHGNLKKFDPDGINVFAKKTFAELYEKTYKRSQEMRSAGYNIVSIWESDWKKKEKELSLNESTNRV